MIKPHFFGDSKGVYPFVPFCGGIFRVALQLLGTPIGRVPLNGSSKLPKAIFCSSSVRTEMNETITLFRKTKSGHTSIGCQRLLPTKKPAPLNNMGRAKYLFYNKSHGGSLSVSSSVSSESVSSGLSLISVESSNSLFSSGSSVNSSSGSNSE